MHSIGKFMVFTSSTSLLHSSMTHTNKHKVFINLLYMYILLQRPVNVFEEEEDEFESMGDDSQWEVSSHRSVDNTIYIYFATSPNLHAPCLTFPSADSA